ncbi:MULTISPECIES: hypothetical protein [unclassified Pseudodesulfovibrio]|uniref:hypothetical protein n=1 Tax=unclassified Pseudodesulfovibrio TaxID=2661612 RepID=UPI000FEBD1D1|nr:MULTISPECIES: hypothetical protein [unclassified Pseudodesulfovibrio]MCJ2163674.1 hypothetical protein [Pseudodesulfovibrio sp. S3-i]RWU06067.1 hypothetical protein DWB63_05200 [Pseudodesulfovibrio sp. S3]
MDITITTPQSPLPIERANSLSMVIKSFKGRRNVEVSLFRAAWDPVEEAESNFSGLIETQDNTPHTNVLGSGRIILESFTDSERDLIIDYLKEQYSTRLTAINSAPLTFPIPAGLAGFTQVQPGKDGGFIEFGKIPSYPLQIPLKGYYDLSQHLPIADDD